MKFTIYYPITIWLIDDVKLTFTCLLVDLIQGFCYSYLTLETGGLELGLTIILALQARINLTNQVRYSQNYWSEIDSYENSRSLES